MGETANPAEPKPAEPKPDTRAIVKEELEHAIGRKYAECPECEKLVPIRVAKSRGCCGGILTEKGWQQRQPEPKQAAGAAGYGGLL